VNDNEAHEQKGKQFGIKINLYDISITLCRL
jgi:hypothetical protein